METYRKTQADHMQTPHQAPLRTSAPAHGGVSHGVLSAYLPSSSCDVAVAASAQAIAIAFSQDHGFAGVVAAKQVLEPGDTEMPKGTKGTVI